MKIRFAFNNSMRVLAVALLVVITAAAPGCDKNTTAVASASTPTASATSSNGSYAAVNKADCLPNVALIDQHGKAVSLASLKGKMVLIDFFYARCLSLCPMLTAKFAQVAKLLGPQLGSKVVMVSVTIDPNHDRPPVLLKYAKTHSANFKGWLFLTGSLKQVENVLKIYKLKRHVNPDGTISHIAMGFLIGPNGKQARIYDALKVPAKTVVADIDKATAHG